MKPYDPTANYVLENLIHLDMGLTWTEDLNTERESLLRLVHELIYILELEA